VLQNGKAVERGMDRGGGATASHQNFDEISYSSYNF
jgi:hypothetical protein